MEEVNVGSEEQTKGIEQITLALSDVESGTTATTAAAVESAAAAHQLNAQSAAVREIVRRLTQMFGGDRPAREIRPGGPQH